MLLMEVEKTVWREIRITDKEKKHESLSVRTDGKLSRLRPSNIWEYLNIDWERRAKKKVSLTSLTRFSR